MESSPLTLGGTPVSDISSMGASIATHGAGQARCSYAADFLREQPVWPDSVSDCLMGLEAVEQFCGSPRRDQR